MHDSWIRSWVREKINLIRSGGEIICCWHWAWNGIFSDKNQCNCTFLLDVVNETAFWRHEPIEDDHPKNRSRRKLFHCNCQFEFFCLLFSAVNFHKSWWNVYKSGWKPEGGRRFNGKKWHKLKVRDHHEGEKKGSSLDSLTPIFPKLGFTFGEKLCFGITFEAAIMSWIQSIPLITHS